MRTAVSEEDRGLSVEQTAGGHSGARASLGRRVWEWLWRGAAEAEWLSSAQLSPRTAFEYSRRAKLSADLAEACVVTAEPLAEPIACELYRHAAYWTLCALTPRVANDFAGRYSDSVWATLEDRWLEPFASTAEARDSLCAALNSGNFVYFSALSPAAQVAMRGVLRELNGALRAKVTEARAGLRRLRLQRAWRLSALAALLVCGLTGSVVLKSRISRAQDLANRATWRVSSAYGEGGCKSPLQECDSTDNWFFHTRLNDSEPWIEFTLDEPHQVTEVVVENREDCCAERAIPLSIEVSDDQEHWRTVAERREPFMVWRATFPAVRTRWVRLHVKRPTALHLKRVRIFP